ncbi:hypothetical protein SporoP37_05255 [Sporosarcina sp. P37]|nr:hypothetical protein SporoP33_04820 [Sporosarcina sp. P33]ARK26184.1 hypothetical protein SporoP37_05255 [Sporosarcina sp. P37]PID17436.1 hypothetical protein CSV62_13740 [Sporosarcina sp. P35]
MVKTITFSFTSSAFAGTEAKETFTFDELEIDESLDEKELEIEINRIYKAWIWDKLNVSGSIVIDEPGTYQ